MTFECFNIEEGEVRVKLRRHWTPVVQSPLVAGHRATASNIIYCTLYIEHFTFHIVLRALVIVLLLCTVWINHCNANAMVIVLLLQTLFIAHCALHNVSYCTAVIANLVTFILCELFVCIKVCRCLHTLHILLFQTARPNASVTFLHVYIPPHLNDTAIECVAASLKV